MYFDLVRYLNDMFSRERFWVCDEDILTIESWQSMTHAHEVEDGRASNGAIVMKSHLVNREVLDMSGIGLYNVGDVVLISPIRTARMNQMGAMDKYLMTKMTIETVYPPNAFGNGLYVYKMKEDGGGWSWTEEMFVDSFKLESVNLKSTIGKSIIRLRNGQWFVVSKVDDKLTGNNLKSIIDLDDYDKVLRHNSDSDLDVIAMSTMDNMDGVKLTDEYVNEYTFHTDVETFRLRLISRLEEQIDV